jgi:hypothetical protein
MRQTLQCNPDIVVVMELKPACGPEADRLLTSIADEGFRLRYIDSDGGLPELRTREASSTSRADDRMLFLSRG